MGEMKMSFKVISLRLGNTEYHIQNLQVKQDYASPLSVPWSSTNTLYHLFMKILYIKFLKIYFQIYFFIYQSSLGFL